jgi:hypothetical protein
MTLVRRLPNLQHIHDITNLGLLRYPNGIKIIAPAGFLWARPGRATCGFLIASAHAGFTEHRGRQRRLANSMRATIALRRGQNPQRCQRP